MTITNVIIKTPDRKCDWGVNDIIPESEGWEFGDFEKAVSKDLTLGHASPAGELAVGDVGTVSIVKIVSLSPRVEKLKVRKLINVSYLNNGDSSVFRISLHQYILHNYKWSPSIPSSTDFFHFPGKIQVFILLFVSFQFYSLVCWNSKVHNSACSLCWLSLGLVVWPRFGDPFVSQNPWVVCAYHSSGQIPGCAYTIC